ncbi:MAG: glycosyltransferase family 2 protein [Lachnospiraceae bacterium]|nr:glycosyltransferase family 2 protein [Lachnospiraceae bacterium]
MLFSVIVPVYNTEKYLRKCLESIREQDFDDYELIIVDDGSTDGCSRICDEFCTEFNALGKVSKAKVIHQKNAGLAGARNRGIKEASGEWLWFVDSDDFIVPGALATLSERMSYAKGDLYAFQYIKVDEAGDNPEYIFFRENQTQIRIKNEGDLCWNYTDRIFNYAEGWEAWSRLFKRSIIEENRLQFKDTKKVFAEDICFLAEYMMCIEFEIRLVNYLYCYRQRESSIMGSLNQHAVFSKHFDLLEDIFFEAKRFEKKQIVKEYDKICLALLKNQLQKFNLITDDEMCEAIEAGCKIGSIGRYIKKIRPELNSEVKGNRPRG